MTLIKIQENFQPICATHCSSMVAYTMSCRCRTNKTAGAGLLSRQ